MSIAKSKEYETAVTVKRLFKTITEDLQGMQKHTEELLAAANGMRRTLASATLAIAQIEALYVDQTEGKHKTDQELYAATVKIKQLMLQLSDKTVEALAAVTDRNVKVEAIKTQVERAATDRFMKPEKEKLADVEYVDIDYFATQLEVSTKTIRRYLEEGLIDPPEHTANPEGRGRPQQLWSKPTADLCIREFQKHGYSKKTGVASACA